MKNVKFMCIVLLAFLAGCKGKENALSDLRAHEWELKSMTENDTIVTNPKQLPVLLFSDSSAVYGSAGCNRFFGTYEAGADGKIKINPGGATMMYCPDMNFEDRYLKSLDRIDRYTVSRQELTLKGENGKLHLVYVPADTTKQVRTGKMLGVAKDAHGCNVAAGYTWSEVRQDCIRLFEEGVRFMAVGRQDTTLAAYVVFSADSTRAEVFTPGTDHYPVLERRGTPQQGYVWNIEDDDTYNVRRQNGKWIIERRGEIEYLQN